MAPRRPTTGLSGLWARLRAWRRIRITRSGILFTLGTLAVGFAAISTGNNLLFLLLGGMLGSMAVSGWISEQTLRNLEIMRILPPGVSVERDLRIRYRITNRKRRLASFAVELMEPGLPGVAFVPRVGPGETVECHATDRFVRRGVYPLESLTLATDFPFGLFRKERDISLPGELVVWPRTDRPVEGGLIASGEGPFSHLNSRNPAVGPRGEFRSLREYRSGDDARDIHWRTSARLRQPVVREYERDAAEVNWIVLDVGHPPGDAAEAAVEVTASLCAQATRRGRTFALTAGPHQLEPGTGELHLERALDVLARVDFGVTGPSEPPVPRDRAVLVTPGNALPGYARVLGAEVASGEPRTGGIPAPAGEDA